MQSSIKPKELDQFLLFSGLEKAIHDFNPPQFDFCNPHYSGINQKCLQCLDVDCAAAAILTSTNCGNLIIPDFGVWLSSSPNYQTFELCKSSPAYQCISHFTEDEACYWRQVEICSSWGTHTCHCWWQTVPTSLHPHRRFIVVFFHCVPGGLKGGRTPAFVSVQNHRSPLYRWLQFFLSFLSSCNESAHERPNVFHMGQAILAARRTFHTAAKQEID